MYVQQKELAVLAPIPPIFSSQLSSVRDDVRLSRELQDHAVRVIRVLERVIARLDSPEKVCCVRTAM